MTKIKPENRKCKRCGKPKGCVAFRYISGGKWTRDYFHVKCFRLELADQKRGD